MMRLSIALTLAVTVAATTSPVSAESRDQIAAELDRLLLIAHEDGRQAFTLPDSDDFESIPQDSANRLTRAKVRLGKFLFHETGFGTRTVAPGRTETYACASCHHAAAGFKAGIPQGIADGGSGFGRNGEGRELAAGLSSLREDGFLREDDDPKKPDVQPVTSPTVLNAAFQDVMLWNGALGSALEGVNQGIGRTPDFGPDGFNVNRFGLSGLETQVLAGTRVHRLDFDRDSHQQSDSLLKTNARYRKLYERAFPGGDTGYGEPDFDTGVTAEALGAAKAIAAYERTVLANRAPFQRWLRGDERAMSIRELRGARLFFGDAGCVGCHTGPALSSRVGAKADELFHAVGFDDFDFDDPRIHGAFDQEASHGRGGFTGDAKDKYRFKVPPMYNLRDTDVFGHGASFSSVHEVIEYKNAGVPQHPAFASDPDAMSNLSTRFRPLGLSQRAINDLTDFLERALYDPSLERYVPNRLPSGNCFPVADFQAALDLRCF